MKLRSVPAILGLVAITAAPIAAQGQAQPPAPPAGGTRGALPDPNALSAGQIQRWFEAFTVLQAQEALQLSETQYGRFVTRLKALQESRRKHQQARTQLLGELRRLTNPQGPAPDEIQVAERLKALREQDERGAAELRRGYDAVDETLDIRQQARFRVFEERMEQQKLELLMRARQNARAAARGRARDGGGGS